ncbi:hypothetical protein [Chondromyces crocatus]|uniref:Uncharacterized protein n=1 Tax=Chondromyces crocatus TaxID=52 RepID=A0A0K1ECU8_CHOCO|nr:hypothetical protein [Chondromyces crocatus]AKT38696.1 uncharacterized protein CMC5_028440 [Chondromyces crocatus]
MTKQLEAIVDEVVVDGYDDWLYLGWISSRVNEGLGLPDTRPGVFDEERLQNTIAVISYVVSNDLMVVGEFGRTMDDFVPWGVTGPEALTRIEKEWRALGRNPRLWEICWFENTAAGHERALRSGLINRREAQHRCPTLRLVVTLDARMSRWCARPIERGHPDGSLTSVLHEGSASCWAAAARHRPGCSWTQRNPDPQGTRPQTGAPHGFDPYQER